MQQLMHTFIGTTVPEDTIAAVRRGQISSFCLFKHLNVETPAQLRELTDSLHGAAREGGFPPPLVGIDQEGGQLIAVSGGATELPGNMALGATRSPELAEQAGRVLGRELLAMGINMNFAPSLDINMNPANPVVGIRSFGDNAELVSTLGVALIQGMQAEGVIATAKHFPGHGDTTGDSHYSTPVIIHSMKRIYDVELAPFRAAIQGGVKAIMSAHILFREMDSVYPATLSAVILEQYLRHEMGFQGVIVTDAMDMQGVAHYGALESVQMAVNAGADLILLAHLPNQFLLSEQSQRMVRPEAVARINALRQTLPVTLPSLDIIGCSEHWQIAQTIADRSITLVKSDGLLPLLPGSGDAVAVITPQPVDLTPADTSSSVRIELADAIRRRHPDTEAFELPANASDNDISAILSATEKAAYVIVGTVGADKDTNQSELVRAIHARGQRLIVVALRTPYDLIAFPMIGTYLCAYGIRRVTTEAIARVLFGEIEAAGVLPCAIPGFSQTQVERTS